MQIVISQQSANSENPLCLLFLTRFSPFLFLCPSLTLCYSCPASVHILEQSGVECRRVQVLHLHRYKYHTHTHLQIYAHLFHLCVCLEEDDKCSGGSCEVPLLFVWQWTRHSPCCPYGEWFLDPTVFGSIVAPLVHPPQCPLWAQYKRSMTGTRCQWLSRVAKHSGRPGKPLPGHLFYPWQPHSVWRWMDQSWPGLKGKGFAKEAKWQKWKEWIGFLAKEHQRWETSGHHPLSVPLVSVSWLFPARTVAFRLICFATFAANSQLKRQKSRGQKTNKSPLSRQKKKPNVLF